MPLKLAALSAHPWLLVGQEQMEGVSLISSGSASSPAGLWPVFLLQLSEEADFCLMGISQVQWL